MLTARAEADSEFRNHELRCEVRALESEASALKDRILRAEESIRISKTASELMTGVRKRPPRVKKVETPVYSEAVEAPVFFDSRSEPAKDRSVWLTDQMRPGETYRFEAEVKTEDFAGSKGVKFGGFAPVSGASPCWPSCPSAGNGTYDWKKLTFTYRLPPGGAFRLSFGPGGGRGKVWFRNVRVFEVKEIEE